MIPHMQICSHNLHICFKEMKAKVRVKSKTPALLIRKPEQDKNTEFNLKNPQSCSPPFFAGSQDRGFCIQSSFKVNVKQKKVLFSCTVSLPCRELVYCKLIFPYLVWMLFYMKKGPRKVSFIHFTAARGHKS